MKKSQEQQVVQQLQENGQVSRNWALRNFISRLSAIILNLRKADWNIETRRERTYGGFGRGLDTIYHLIK